MLLKIRRKPGVLVISLVGLFLLALTLFSQLNQDALAQNNQVKVCHKGEVIEVLGDENAVNAHLNHGDCRAKEDEEKGAPCECEAEVLAVVLKGEGDSISIEFTLDTGLADQDPSRDKGFFMDSREDWHFIVGGALRLLSDFTIEVLPGKGACDDVIIIKAEFDDPNELGSRFAINLGFEARTLNGDSLPGAGAFPCKGGILLIFDETDEPIFKGTITSCELAE